MTDQPGCPCSICECDYKAERQERTLRRLLGPRIQVDLEGWRDARGGRSDG